MGLSDTERRERIFWGISQLLEEAREVEPRDTYIKTKRLKDLCEELWHAFLGNSANGAHWILGSETDNPIVGNASSPWDAAVGSALEDLRRSQKENPLDNLPSLPIDFLKIQDFLTGNFQHVYMVYKWTEQIVYVLRRYKDDFLNDLQELSKIISKIQGECFSIFANCTVYMRAYLAHNICKKLFLFDNDVVSEVLAQELVHHNIVSKVRNYSGKHTLTNLRLMQIHTELCRIRKEDLSKHKNQLSRMLFALEIAGSGFHYEHQHEAILARLRTAQWPDKSISRVKSHLKKFCQKEKEIKKGFFDEYVDELFYEDFEKQTYKKG